MRVKPGDVHPGLGRVDFAECARALEEIGYDGWLTLETPPVPPPLVARDFSFTRSSSRGSTGAAAGRASALSRTSSQLPTGTRS